VGRRQQRGGNRAPDSTGEPSVAGVSSTPTTALRRCLLSVCVLGDLDMIPHDDGVELTGPVPVLVGWEELEYAVGTFPPESPIGRRRVEELLRLRLAVAQRPPGTGLGPGRARVVALPPGHAAHPGPTWVREVVPGGVLELGLGVAGLLPDEEAVIAVPPMVEALAGGDTERAWTQARAHADRMGALAVHRLRRSGDGVLRPVGGCDAFTLLSTEQIRRQMIGSSPLGMTGLVAPTRREAWPAPVPAEPEFLYLAWTMTDAHDRGTPYPLMITRDEVGAVVRH
jgi:hypothetical protein